MNIQELIQHTTGLRYNPVGSSGKEYAGVCPSCGGEGGHNGKGGRFRIWPGEGRYWCRECGRQGDSIQFLRDYKHLSFVQAKEFLGLDSANNGSGNNHIDHNRRNHDDHKEAPLLQPPCQAWTESASAFLAESQSALWDERGVKALAWLRSRGLFDDTIHQASLGYNARDHYIEREVWGLPLETNDQGKPKRLWLPRGIVIPWCIDGILWGVRIRRPPGTDPKYYWIPGGTPNVLYGADTVLPGKPSGLCEGEFDSLTIRQAGYGAVATGSTHAARRTRWLARLSLASVVLVSFDTDDAGEKAAQYWIDTLPNAKRWRPYWSDANQLAQDGVNVGAWIRAGLGHQTLETASSFETDTATKDDTAEDLTAYIGHTITAEEWASLQAECERRHGGDWTFRADMVDGSYYIRGLTAI